MTMAIYKLVAGVILLSEMLSRICGGNTPREVYYNLCRPFFLRMPMHTSIFITVMQTVAGTLLAFDGLLMLANQ